MEMISYVAKTKSFGECEYQRITLKDSVRWVRLHMKYISSVNGKNIMLGTVSDVTTQKEIEIELNKYRRAITKSETVTNKILVVDDQEINRAILEEIFSGQYTVLTAENGKQAIEVLEQNNNNVDIILLDLVMPVMNGNEFLRYKKEHESIADIPTIIITADDSPEQQVNTFNMGADDYIVKPFVQEVVLKRVNNVLRSSKHLREVLSIYGKTKEKEKADPLTSFYNRASAEEIIKSRIAEYPEKCYALIIIDLDYFKEINKTYGVDFGNKILTNIAVCISDFWNANDIIARFEGDKFCVFTEEFGSEADVIKNCDLFRDAVQNMKQELSVQISVSVGISVSLGTVTNYEAMYKQAGLALYNSKKGGRNKTTLFGTSVPITVGEKFFNKEWIVERLENPIYIIDYETYEMLYISSAGIQLLNTKNHYEGKKCYELFHSRSEPCPFCVNDKLSYDEYYFWRYKFESNGLDLLLKDKLVDFNGKIVHLQIAENIIKADGNITKEENFK